MNTAIQVRPLDAWDDAEMDAAYDVWRLGEMHERPYAVVMGRDELRADLVRPSATQSGSGWVALQEDVVVGVATATWPLVGAPTHCWPTLVVVPLHRRLGVASELWRVLERAVRLAGRTVVQVEVGHPLRDTPWPGMEFARRHGFTLALREEHLVLDLAASRVRAKEPLDGYTLRTWRDHCPAELLPAFCGLRERFVQLAPTGDLDVGEPAWDAARLRGVERRRADLGRSAWTTASVAPSGELVGFTDLMGTAAGDDVFQNETMVLPEHRGHRLGLSMKVANLWAMLADQPYRTLVHTWVSPDNAHMRAVNSALGFEPVELLDEWQRDLRVPP